jgi:hypothetical protein
MSDVELLLAGLEVESISELKALVDTGRAEWFRRQRRAEMAAAVAALPDARQRLIAALEIAQQEGRDENGLFVCVNFIDGGDPINVSGVWPSEADAFLGGEADREPDVVQVVLPLFVSNAPARQLT